MLRVALAAVLAVPALAWLALTAPLVTLLLLPAICLLQSRKQTAAANRRCFDPATSLVIITGGSSGIGLELAKEARRRGVRHIYLLARHPQRLDAAQREIQNIDAPIAFQSEVHVISVDVTDAASLHSAAAVVFSPSLSGGGGGGHHPSVNRVEPQNAHVFTTYLYCCAGFCIARRFQDLTPADMATQVQTNQLGVQYTIHAMLPHMRNGNIVICCSMGGQVGIYGLGGYAPTKFALRGLAECLHMELLDRDIYVQLAYPPDTETPGLRAENQGKPSECARITGTASLLSPAQVAGVMVRQTMLARCPKFNITFDVDGWMLAALTSGMQPFNNVVDGLTQVAGMSLFRLIALLYVANFHRIVYACRNEREVDIDAAAVTEAASKETASDTDKSK